MNRSLVKNVGLIVTSRGIKPDCGYEFVTFGRELVFLDIPIILQQFRDKDVPKRHHRAWMASWCRLRHTLIPIREYPRNTYSRTTEQIHNPSPVLCR